MAPRTVAFLIAGNLCAQTALQFEAATVRLSTNAGGGVRGGCHGIDSHHASTQAASAPPLGRCVITDARLSHLISIAYRVASMSRIKSGPDWIARGDLRYNVEAKAEDPARTTEEQLQGMLQNLLVERFQLKFHRETVAEPGFALTVARNGPELPSTQAAEPEMHISDTLGKPRPGEPISVTARKCSLAALTSVLSLVSAHPVVDRTGLQGEYDFTLTWDDTLGPALSTAIQEQLGLRLEPQKVPVSLFVVDSAQKPAEN